MALIPFPTSSAPGVNAPEGGGRLINMYAEPISKMARSQIRWTRTPGILQETDNTNTAHCRGIIQLNDPGSVPQNVIVIYNNQPANLTVRNANGTWQSFLTGGPGSTTITGTRPVTIARNNHVDPQFVIVKPEGGAYVVNFQTLVTSVYPDADLPTPNSVDFLDGYFLFTTASGYIWASNINTTDVATNSFTQAQQRPDGLLRGVAYRGQYFAFGQNSCEVYRNIGASPFPLEFQVNIPRGICGTHAVAGHEAGWANDLIWVADDDQVYRLNGYVPEPISTSDVSRAIHSCADVTLLEAVVYMNGYNALWALTSPGEWTWVYNKSTNEWHEQLSQSRNDWRGSASCHINGNWIIGDRTTGKLGRISSTTYQEFGGDIASTMESGPVAAFPARIYSARADFDHVRNTTASTVLISWSNDGGENYKTPVSRDLTSKYVSVFPLGLSNPKGKRFRLSSDDNAPFTILGGQVAAQAGAE